MDSDLMETFMIAIKVNIILTLLGLSGEDIREHYWEIMCQLQFDKDYEGINR